MAGRARHRSRRRRAICSLLVAPVAVAMSACGSSAPDVPAASQETSSPSSSAPTTSGAPAAPSSASTVTAGTGAQPGDGCAATGTTVPDGARPAPTADLDGDGRVDTLWLAERTAGDGALVRTLGVATASGAVFSTDFNSAAPQAAGAVAQRLSKSGPAIVLLNTGRSVPLYAVVGCQLVASTNAQGQQYTFDLGVTGYGSGVGCEPVGSSDDLALYGLLAHQAKDGTWSVTGTRIDLSQQGRRADNGPTSELVTGARDADVPAIAAARTVACGDQD